MNRKILLLTFALLLVIDLKAQTSKELTVPRDSSFTFYSAWMGIRKKFPEAVLVKPVLPKGVIAQRELVYATLPATPYGKRALHFDLFRPAQPGRYPALVMIHGGGWRSGDKGLEAPMAMQIAARGYVTVCVEYRLSPEALYPAAVYDIKAAIRYLRADAVRYSIDPNKIAVSGTSAGGQLAALIGTTGKVKKFDGGEGNPTVSGKVQAVIDIDGVLDFTDPNESGKDENPAKPSAGTYWFGATYKQAPEKWVEASALTYAGKDTPPMAFINSALPRFHAGRDSVITLLNRYHIYSEVHTIDNTPHPFWLFEPWFTPTVSYMVNFLDKVFYPSRFKSKTL